MPEQSTVGFAPAFVWFFKTDKSVDVLAIRTSDTNCVAPLSHAQVNGHEIAFFLSRRTNVQFPFLDKKDGRIGIT